MALPEKIDARGPRFGAAITTVVLAVAFLSIGTPLATALLVIQTVVFGIGAIAGPHVQPYGILFAKVIKPRLAPATKFEAPQPPRFAQAVGLGFAVAALVGVVAGLEILTTIAVGFAFAAAFLNAVFNFCLGCEMYLLIRRFTASAA